MDAVNKLLDKAKETCSLASDRALAARIGVSAQQVSQWRKGANPMSDDRVAQVAVIARQPIDLWMVTIRAEQAGGAAAKAWSSLAHKLATSAAAVFMLILATLPAAPIANASQRNAQAQAEGNQAAPVDIMRRWLGTWARLSLSLWRDVLLWIRWRFARNPSGPNNIEARAC